MSAKFCAVVVCLGVVCGAVGHATEPAQRSADTAAYVALDSWVYEALERLGSLGLITDQFLSLRPWTRSECYRQTLQASRNLDTAPDEVRNDAAELIRALMAVLVPTASYRWPATVDRGTLRSGMIAGPALTDSYHIGQTWSNDFGRPFGRGMNGYVGVDLHGGCGRIFFGARAEYQHAPALPAPAPGVADFLADVDSVPRSTPQARPAVRRFSAVEAYAGVLVGNIAATVGRQSLWWGPTFDAPMSFSNNAEPISALRLSTIHPVRLPRVGRFAPEVRVEYVIGKLDGHRYTSEPWVNAQKVSFALTENLEMGFTRWSIFWGAGHPKTIGSFIRNLTSVTSSSMSSAVDRSDAGDRKGGFDFRYRVPGLRRWVTLYADSYSDDDPSPLAAPRRAAISPGLLVTRVPGLPKLQLRAESASTMPPAGDYGGHFIYFNDQYRSGNTNGGNLLGNSVGRDGRAVQGWVTYLMNSHEQVQVAFRHRKIGPAFLPGGGTQADATVKSRFQIAERTYIETMLGYERFWIPLIGGEQRNVSAWVRVVWEPGIGAKR